MIKKCGSQVVAPSLRDDRVVYGLAASAGLFVIV